MIYFDDVFYKEYKNTGKQLFLLDKNGTEYPVTLKENELAFYYSYVDDEDIVMIHTHEVTWYKTDITDNTKYCIGEIFVTAAKEQALKLDIVNELRDHIVPIQCYFDYYKAQELELTVYAIANYDVRQDNKSSIIVKFAARGDRMASAIDHKIQGIAPSQESKGRVVSTSVEAWRYKKLAWVDIRNMCPEFVAEVLQGHYP